MIDRSCFDPAAVDPETRRLNEAVEKLLADQKPVTEFPPRVIREARERGESVWGPIETDPEAEVRRLELPAGSVGVRILRPSGPARGVYLHLHGGGWTLGAAHHADLANRRLARRCDVVVVSVDYRLAPEHPYPAAPDDCEAVARWLVQGAASEFGCDRLVIGGESAGAHLAVSTLLRLRDRDGHPGFAGANLVYGCYDLTFTPSVRRWGVRNLVLSTPIIEWFTDHFVPDRERRADPDVSPLHADLAGLPPAHFTVGSEDPLLDDTLFLHARWLAAGNAASLFVAPGGMHGFDALPHALAKQARREATRFVAGVLDAA
jgi:acetyl esterase/lipase